MAHVLSTVSHWYAGDSRQLSFTLGDEAGNAIDVSDATISWELFDQGYDLDTETPEIDDSDSGVSIEKDPITDPTAGEFRIDIAEGVTDGFWGKYWMRVTVDKSGETNQQWRGKVIIES